MSMIPQPAAVTMIDKGKSRNVFLKIDHHNDKGFILYVGDSPNSILFKTSYPIKRSIVEAKPSDPTKCSLLFLTTTQEITFSFKTPEEANSYLKFISEKSDVHAENRAIEQLDEEMKQMWPLPGGNYF
ncbi:hypothetical protein TVAG_478380 [Trichomonas vaginalis G3]|uniref:Uncharacterized protein n=1 Tax=Trichomonas vaginalis (strain ATCC PRA-98 / G3) TaxID=412133 RepID=A2DZV4_TRIV3|nr:hypothetical protein TVAGG3_0536780 [Trichomonas vaginalis G3]EAY14013.1 hypothetical protein TVAG_478380 [Trichomonas vaginalis G3]KAI5519553.1 hypothetical protein TVAGG3_0536780 [Trichomonas vaginalis G3]|eukprot:XP_001326236.1 hypothetical protein [Trichomonas vaginalis G3]